MTTSPLAHWHGNPTRPNATLEGIVSKCRTLLLLGPIVGLGQDEDGGANAAEQLLRLVRFAGTEEIRGSPYRPAGFCFFAPVE